MFKVIVTGFVTESFIGSAPDVEKYLSALKSKQMLAMDTADKKIYKKINNENYYNPSDDRKMFREKYRTYGLTIKIEPHINTFF